MPPADATPTARSPEARVPTGPDSGAVPLPRSAPEAESAPTTGTPTPTADAAASTVDAAAAPESVGALDEREQEILAFERQWWRHAGAKEQAIRDRFGLSATRYYQLLNALLDNPAALAADPVLVGRLRRLRASRARSRRR
ncbi:DUF3263 domain-containing protein [Micromonospora sp. DT229]|uniref:DUF3263 domain-containing protein n=1 Tax=Micromonospora sp. DT229 TaxID=3393430 RepID=UPI003CE9408E